MLKLLYYLTKCVNACRMSDDDFSDDDDTSWKVRRSAAKCLVAIINSYSDLLSSLYPKVSPLLVARFKEREESVKIDVFHAFIELLHQVSPSNIRCPVNTENIQQSSEHQHIFLITNLFSQVGAAASRDRASQVLRQLQSDSPEVLKASFRQLRDRSLKTRAGVLLTLKELISIVPKCLSHDVEQLLPGLTAALNVSAL